MDETLDILSDYAYNLTFDDLPAEVVHQTKRTLIDTIGCALGGFPAEPSEIARKLASRITDASPARILGTALASSPEMAGFANSVMVRYLDYNDAYFSPGGGHPSDMIPAVLALADPLKSDGKQVITAIVLAYEVFCRLSDAVVVSERGWDQGAFSVAGAALGAGKIMRLSHRSMKHAVSLAVTPNMPLLVTRVGELSMWKGCAAACATRAGIFAAQLAQLGMTGPETPFEGRFGVWDQIADGPVQLSKLGNDTDAFRMMNTIFKLFPSQIHTQGPIDLALELQSQVILSEIESIRIRTYHTAVRSAATEPQKWAPQTRETADHSIPYLVAVAILEGKVTPESFSRARLQDPEVSSLIEKITVEEDKDYTGRFPQEYPCWMEVALTTGQRLMAELSYPQGHFRNPMSDDQVVEKFTSLSSHLLSKEQCDAALEILWSFDRLSDLSLLFDKLIIDKK